MSHVADGFRLSHPIGSQIMWKVSTKEDQDHASWVAQGVDFRNNPFGIKVQDPFQLHRTEEALGTVQSEKSSLIYFFKWTTVYQLRHMMHRRLSATRKGYIGLNPPNYLEGDTIAIILGAKVQSVLKSRKAYFEPIGDIYVRGIILRQATDRLKRRLEKNIDVETVGAASIRDLHDF